MNYNGTIVGFQSRFGSIYRTIDLDKKCTSWTAQVNAVLNGKTLQITFPWFGDEFELVLIELKVNYYSGKLLLDGVEFGSSHLWMYKRNDDILLKGDYVEEIGGTFECFVELKSNN